MPPRQDQDDSADDDLRDWEDPDESDMDDDDDDGPAMVPCPYCRKEISEDAEICPRCGNFISQEDSARRMPTWIVVGVALAILVVLVWVLFG